MLRILFIVAAALMMAACDGNPGDEPRDTYHPDTSGGKGDGPNPTDTTHNDTAVTDTSTPMDTVQVEDPCKDLQQYTGSYHRLEPQSGHALYDETLDMTVSPSSTNGECVVTVEAYSFYKPGPLYFRGSQLPLEVKVTAADSPDGFYTTTLSYEDNLIKLRVYDSRVDVSVYYIRTR